MYEAISNPCIRCGKPRIPGKTWKEEIMTGFGKSVITHTENVCPDSECQKEVEKKLELQRQNTKALKDAREERMQNIRSAKKNKAKGQKIVK